ncbi:MAG: VOC family protein [Acetobacteraceae bacterium]|nr:VOC family protein [Acetobacteraceae bacterium]
MTVQALGYLGIGSSKLDDWASFATGRLGMQPVERGGAMRAFRMDDRKQRLIIDCDMPAGERTFGWELADAAALDTLASRLDRAGVAVRREPAALADQRYVGGLISFADPAGNRLEAFHNPQIADEPFRPGRDIAGFRAGPLGMGHVLLMVPHIDSVLAFYRDLLGFRISDFIRTPVAAYFLHVNPRHHSLALVEGPTSAMHHLMIELYSFDDVGQAYDLALADPGRVAVTLGRHPNDLMTSFYQRTPSDILVEYGWGGREVDDAIWQPVEMIDVGSFWGHQGLFDSLAGDARSPGAPPPMMPSPGSRRAPLQVMDGNYQRMAGVCPWWDTVRGTA